MLPLIKLSPIVLHLVLAHKLFYFVGRYQLFEILLCVLVCICIRLFPLIILKHFLLVIP